MDDDIGSVDGLIMGVGGAVDVGELEDFFDDGKYRHDGFALMIIGILDHVLALKEFMWH